ncbi:MAG: hypothetical protein WA268_04325 [Xanthobacteraceae bacterium]
MPQTLTEEIIAAHAVDCAVSAGGIATVTPDVLMLNDVSGPLAFDQFEAMGADCPAAPDRVVLVVRRWAPIALKILTPSFAGVPTRATSLLPDGTSAQALRVSRLLSP